MDSETEHIFKTLSKTSLIANLDNDVIATTEDKLRLNLIKYQDKLGKKKDWLTPFGILVTIILKFASSEFKDFILAKNTWEALFIMIGIASFIWLLKTLPKAFGDTSLEKLIQEIKNSGNQN